MRRRRVLAAAVLVVAAAVLGACGGDDDEEAEDEGSAQTVDLKASDFRFEPTEIELKAGQPVVFEVRNAGDAKHNLTVAEFNFDRDVNPGESVQLTTTPAVGTYTFTCEFHPGQMTGTITVT